MSIRVMIAILGTYAAALLYTHRAGLSVAIVAMVRPKNISHRNESGSCLPEDHNSLNETIGSGNYEWSETLQGIILGATFYMYIITPTVSGRVTEMFGAKWLTAVSVFAPAILSALTPIAADYHYSLVIAIRVVMGGFHGCIYASLFALYANWFPKSERATAVAGLAFGGNLGSTIAFPLSGYLCENGFAGGWPSVFYVIALAHIPWLLLWIYFVDNSPLNSNRISAKELEYIKKNIESFGAPKRTSTAPWLKIITSRLVWTSVIAKVSGGWGYFLLLSKMPSFLDSVYGIPIFQNGIFNALTTLATGIAMLIGGPLSGLILKRTKLSKTRVRKIFQDIALIGPAVCIGLVPAMGCNSNAVVVLLVIAMLLYGFITGGEWPVISEFAPDFAGTIFGIANVFSMCTAFVAPYIVGVLLDENPGNRSQWNLVFYITVGVYLIGAIVFEIFASAEPTEWGLIPKTEKNDKDLNNKDLNKNVKLKSKKEFDFD